MIADPPAATPGWQDMSCVISLAGLSTHDAIDGDGRSETTNDATWQRRDVLDERHAFGQVVSVRQELRQPFWRQSDDEFASRQPPSTAHGVQISSGSGFQAAVSALVTMAALPIAMTRLRWFMPRSSVS